MDILTGLIDIQWYTYTDGYIDWINRYTMVYNTLVVEFCYTLV